ncbi:MAG: ketoacyl-ACP synthase III [Balneolaceae bacterium]|nr:ketoacyl-ACP synthase III [Balneolaceae bacterium]
MGTSAFENIGIRGISAAVPSRVIDNYGYTEIFSGAEVKKVVDKIGIFERRFTDENTTASDLCYAAASTLLSEMNIKSDEIDVLLFVSQTPDYRMPATSVILQDRLKLGKSTLAFDISLGCSAFIFALHVAYSFLQNQAFRNVLILNGETRSKVYSPKDRKTAFIFGDAGAAVLVGKGEKYGKSFFSLNSDGAKESVIKMDAGGYRNPSSPEGFEEKVVDEYGNIRHAEHGYMDGESVFSFVSKEVPKDLRRLFKFSNMNESEIDFFIFHQASKIINDYLLKKLNLEKAKVPQNFQKFGNTSSVSIPLAIVSELNSKLGTKTTICLSAFGVGLSWGSAIINTHNCFITDLIEVESYD